MYEWVRKTKERKERNTENLAYDAASQASQASPRGVHRSYLEYRQNLMSNLYRSECTFCFQTLAQTMLKRSPEVSPSCRAASELRGIEASRRRRISTGRPLTRSAITVNEGTCVFSVFLMFCYLHGCHLDEPSFQTCFAI